MDGNDDVEALYFSFSFTTAEEEENEDFSGEASGKPRSAMLMPANGNRNLSPEINRPRSAPRLSPPKR